MRRKCRTASILPRPSAELERHSATEEIVGLSLPYDSALDLPDSCHPADCTCRTEPQSVACRSRPARFREDQSGSHLTENWDDEWIRRTGNDRPVRDRRHRGDRAGEEDRRRQSRPRVPDARAEAADPPLPRQLRRSVDRRLGDHVEHARRRPRPAATGFDDRGHAPPWAGISSKTGSRIA